MLFRLKVRLGFANGTIQDIPLTVLANDEKSLAAIVTRDYIMANVSDDWGPPIENVTILEAAAIQRPLS